MWHWVLWAGDTVKTGHRSDSVVSEVFSSPSDSVTAGAGAGSCPAPAGEAGPGRISHGGGVLLRGPQRERPGQPRALRDGEGLIPEPGGGGSQGRGVPLGPGPGRCLPGPGRRRARFAAAALCSRAVGRAERRPGRAAAEALPAGPGPGRVSSECRSERALSCVSAQGHSPVVQGREWDTPGAAARGGCSGGSVLV